MREIEDRLGEWLRSDPRLAAVFNEYTKAKVLEAALMVGATKDTGDLLRLSGRIEAFQELAEILTRSQVKDINE